MSSHLVAAATAFREIPHGSRKTELVENRRTQVVDHAHAERPGESGAIAYLPGEPPLGTMGDGLAMEAYDVEAAKRR